MNSYRKDCYCDQCSAFRETPEGQFRMVEDERAEFEATFRALGYCLDREPADKRIHDDARGDYTWSDTGHAWAGWLAAAGVEWMPAP